MSTARPFGRNTGNPLVGTAQFGDLVVGLQNLPYDENYGGIQWWNGADEELGYVIGTDVPAENHPTPVGNVGSVRFWRTTAFTDNDFVFVAQRVTNQSFTGATDAYIWLTNNGYWTSYVPNTPIFSEVLDGGFIRQEYATNTDTIWTTKFSVGEMKIYNGPDFTTSTTIGLTPGQNDGVQDIIYGPNLNRIFVSYANFGIMQMFNPNDNTLVATNLQGNDGNMIRTMAYNLINSTVWMVSGQESKVYVVSATTSSLTSITGITLSNFTAQPTSITWNSNRNLMYIGGSREIDVVDCETNTKILEINGLENGFGILIDNMVYDPIHDRIYFGMTSLTIRQLKIYYLDCETNTISSAIHTATNVDAAFTSMEYDINGYVWIGTSLSVLILNTTTNTVSVGDTQFNLSSDIIFKSSKNQMICARGSTNNALIYDVTTVY